MNKYIFSTVNGKGNLNTIKKTIKCEFFCYLKRLSNYTVK